ncbi:MAG: aminopeptidase P family protein [Rhodothermales bacterium]|nr:aminopeptidase P family protein [Rhodothermales bacterium]
MQLPALEIVRKSLVSIGYDAAVVSHLPHIRRITGFTGSNALLFVSRRDALLLTDGRYSDQVARETQNVEYSIESGSLVESILEKSVVQGNSTVAVQGEYLVAQDFARIESFLHSHGANAVLTKDWLQAVFAAKSDGEIESIRQAQAITDRVLEQIPGLIRKGITEKELAAEIVHLHMIAGADRMSFDPIVAFGENSALPHARPTLRTLRHNEPVLIDMGCFNDGYASDMTRMIYYGRPDPKFLQIHGIVLESKRRAIDSVRAGLSCRGLDEMARSHIRSSGYEDKFVHSLGHGVGLEVHEYPSVSTRSAAHLEKGMVITIEPGIYLTGEFGVRVEDIVAVGLDGCDVLTSSPSELLVVE